MKYLFDEVKLNGLLNNVNNADNLSKRLKAYKLVEKQVQSEIVRNLRKSLERVSQKYKIPRSGVDQIRNGCILEMQIKIQEELSRLEDKP